MFVYVMVMIRKSGRLKATDLLHLIPFLIITIFFAFRFYVLSGPEKVDFYNQIYNGQLPRDVSIMTFPNILTGPIYVILSLIKLSAFAILMLMVTSCAIHTGLMSNSAQLSHAISLMSKRV